MHPALSPAVRCTIMCLFVCQVLNRRKVDLALRSSVRVIICWSLGFDAHKPGLVNRNISFITRSLLSPHPHK